MKAVKGQTRCHWFGYTDICKNVYYFLIKTFFKKEYFLVHLYLFLGCRKLLETLWKMLSETESEGRRRSVKAWTPLHSGTGRSGQIQRPSSPWRRNSNLFNVCKEINRSWREKNSKQRFNDILLYKSCFGWHIRTFLLKCHHAYN